METKWNYTMLAENKWDELKDKFKCLPRESAMEQLEDISRKKGKSDYYSRLSELMENCGFDSSLAQSKSLKEISGMIEGLPGKKEMSGLMLEELYSLYKEYRTPGEYMERIVKNTGNSAYGDDSVRVSILKQFVKRLQKDGKSSHPGVAAVIKYLNACEKNGEEGIIQEDIFSITDGYCNIGEDEKKRMCELCDKITDSETNAFSSDARLRKIKSLCKKPFFGEKDLKFIKEFGEEFSAGNDEETAENLFKGLKGTLNVKRCTELQLRIIKRVEESTDIPWKERKKQLLDYVMMLKNTTIEGGRERYVTFYDEQLRLLEKAANIIRKYRNEIVLSDSDERIYSFNKHVYSQIGSTDYFEELMIDNLRVLLNSVNIKNGTFRKIESFVTHRIEVAKDKKDIADRIYKICRKPELTDEQKSYAEELAGIISSISPVKTEGKVKMAEAGKKLLKTADDLASCTFRTNGSTRKDLYIFAFAFGLKIYPDKTCPGYNKYRDIENLFFDVYNDDLFRYLEENDFKDNSAVPNGEGVNYKNFAEAVCLYYLAKDDDTLTPYDRYERAMSAIEKCKESCNAPVESTGSTMFYKKLYWDEILNVDESRLIDFVCRNYYVPGRVEAVSAYRVKEDISPLTPGDLEEITGVKVPEGESAALNILKRFISCGFTGDAKITGVTTFRKKAVENGFCGISDKNDLPGKLTDEAIDLFMKLKMKDDDKILGRLVRNLASGDFIKYSTARENLYKLAFAYGLTAEETEEKLLLRYYDTGIDYTEKLDTVCAYYLMRDDLTAGEKLKKAFTLIKNKDTEELDEDEIIVSDKYAYFNSYVTAMDEDSLRHYVMTQFDGVIHAVNDFDVFSEEITAFELYNSIIDEIIEFEGFGYDDEENSVYIRSELRDDIERIHDEFREAYGEKYDDRFFEMLGALEEMVKLNKDINRKNINRTDFIVLEYYKILADLSEEVFDLEETYSEVISYIDADLTDARFQPLNPKNMFDLYVICMVYRKIMTN